ncbi:hypothetical protein M8C21_025090 [Ambrosia artemisiifolia]|uniref:Uncharacterized protein n=1 Tax=Ambrosia artemisiifolia TaxID=4212 RepID=A0AAD5GAD6_AMBAR|nr:hypothetical protein M8C21_025090 [Ambrosia artemisiifolia]
MEASTSKGLMSFVSMSSDKNMKPERKHEGMGVDAINCKNGDAGGSGQPQHDDATASSSSFGDTFSDHGTRGYESDNEVMSDLRGNAAPMHTLGGSGDLFPLRKKRLTSHWRKFVQPIMWRCKWVELQLRKFESMAIMYDEEIEKHKQTKLLKYNNFELEGRCARSMPFVHDSQRQKLMKRKIRKRLEESDTEFYMLHHNISSYLATCRSPTHGPTMDDDETNLGPSSPKNVYNEFRVPDELLSLDFRDGYSLEQILWKIEAAQSQVSKMKDRLDTLTTENAGRISSTEDLILQESNNPLTRPLMKLNTGDDVVKPENAASESTQVQDANEPMEQAEQPDDASRKRLGAPEDAKENNNTAPVSVSEDSSQNEQPAQKIRSISKLTTPENSNKRAARPRRRRGSSQWSRRISG